MCYPPYMTSRTELTPSQSEFVRAYIVTGDPVESYLASFDTVSRASAQASASRLLGQTKIKAAIREMTDERITTFVPVALKTLTDIAQTANHKDASANAKHVLALAGYQPHQIIEVHKIDTATKIKAIIAMVSTLRGMGTVIDLEALVPRQLIGNNPVLTEDDEFIGS